MFVKVKFETNSLNNDNENSSQNEYYFELDGEASVLDVKRRLEEYVKVPADKLEVKTLTATIANDRELRAICPLECQESVAVMVYHLSEAEPNFFCILQISNNAIDSLSSKKSSTNIPSTSHSDNSERYVFESAESLSESQSSSSSHSSSESKDSDSSSDSRSTLDGEEKKKRRGTVFTLHDFIQKKRRIDSLGLEHSLRSYLDEFPRYNEESTRSNEKERENNEDPSTEQHRQSVTTGKPQFQVNHSPDQTSAAECANNALNVCNDENNKVNGTEVDTTTKSITTGNEQPPWAGLQPEKRAFMVAIGTESGDLTKNECAEFLQLFFDIFRQSHATPQLQFNEYSELNFFEGKLWIACNDAHTLNWICESTQQLQRLYRTQLLTEFLNLQKFVLVIPSVNKSSNLKDVFELLEKQNTNLNTAQWIVQSRAYISGKADEYFDKCISSFCQNEVLVLYIDKESKEFIEKRDFKLKYCFWKVEFLK